MRVLGPDGEVRSVLRLSAADRGREAALQEYYAGKIAGLRAELERADARAVGSHAEHLSTMDTLEDYVARCDELVAAASAAQARASAAEEELATARLGFDEQLAIMTEHMVAMNERAREQEERVAPMEAARVLCGVCKRWNSVADLLGERGQGGLRCLHGDHQPEGFDPFSASVDGESLVQ